MGELIEIMQSDAIGLPSPGGTIQTTSNGYAEAGMFLPAPGGRRLFYGTAGEYCLFVGADTSPAGIGKLGRIYMQTRFSFAEHMLVGGVAAQLATSLAGTQATIKNFLNLFLGAVSCASGPVAWGITGMNVAVTAGKIKQEFHTYSKGIEAIYEYMRYYSGLTPNLTQAVLGPLGYNVLSKNVKGKAMDLLTGALPGPKVAGKLTGVFLAACGENQVDTRLKAISNLMKEVLVKVAVHQQEHMNEKLSAQQVSGLAKHVITQLTPAGLVSGQSTAEKIVVEVAANCFKVRQPLSDIAAALDAL
ncbi:MAG: hypothetical protein NTY38_31520 [Acidobacteria bacterium]|nr:hypothetical protein [Acidobacteriota bacterium]